MVTEAGTEATVGSVEMRLTTSAVPITFGIDTYAELSAPFCRIPRVGRPL